jgi:NADH-quinone oxidoreductase subunit E
MNAQSRPASKIGLLSQPSRSEIDREIAKYPTDHKQAAVMAALRIAQEQNGGWLPADLIEAVAEYLDMPAIAAHEVATFYTMYDLKPVGAVCVQHLPAERFRPHHEHWKRGSVSSRAKPPPAANSP